MLSSMNAMSTTAPGNDNDNLQEETCIKVVPNTSDMIAGLQAIIEKTILPAVSLSCNQYMTQLASIFQSKLDEISHKQAGSKCTSSILEDDVSLVSFMRALQNQDSDQLIQVLGKLDRIENMLNCISLSRLVDFLSLLAQFLSRRILLLTMTASSSTRSDVLFALPWILDGLLALQARQLQSQFALESQSHASDVLSAIKEQTGSLQQTDLGQDEHGSILLKSMEQVLYSIPYEEDASM